MSLGQNIAKVMTSIITGIGHATPIFGEIDKVLVLDRKKVLLKYSALREINSQS